jgi:hypothetical protein
VEFGSSDDDMGDSTKKAASGLTGSGLDGSDWQSAGAPAAEHRAKTRQAKKQ